MHGYVMKDPATAPWGIRISDADLKRLVFGFQPRDHDDKWAVAMEHNPCSRSIAVHVARTGPYKEYYILVVKPRGDGPSSGGVEVAAITWEQDKNGIPISEEQAKKEVVAVTRCILECDIEEFPRVDWVTIWEYPVEG